MFENKSNDNLINLIWYRNYTFLDTTVGSIFKYQP